MQAQCLEVQGSPRPRPLLFPGINEAKQKDGNRAPMLLLPSQSAVIRMGLLPKLPGAGECVDIESFPPGAFSACSMHACQANRKASSANRKTASQQSLRSSNWCFDQANRRGLPSSRPSGFWFFLFSVEHTEQTKSARKQPDSGRNRRLTCEVD